MGNLVTTYLPKQAYTTYVVINGETFETRTEPSYTSYDKDAAYHQVSGHTTLSAFRPSADFRLGEFYLKNDMGDVFRPDYQVHMAMNGDILRMDIDYSFRIGAS